MRRQAECTTFGHVIKIAQMINTNGKRNPNPNPNLNPYPTLNQKPNHYDITLTLTLCCLRYHCRRNCRRSKCWITAKHCLACSL